MISGRPRTGNQGHHRRTEHSRSGRELFLKPVTGRPPLPEYVAQLWQRRHFIKAEARAKAFSGTRNMVLGNLWLIIGPFLDVAVYGLIFGMILKTSRGIDQFVPYLVVGVILFRMLAKDLNDGSNLIRSHRNIIKAFPFPRAALVFSLKLRGIYDSLPPIIVLLLFIYLYPNGPNPNWTAVLFFPVFCLLKLFGTGLTFLSAWMTHIIPDLSKIIQFFSRFWFYISGVFFSIDRFVEQPQLLKIMQGNPAYQILSMSRDLLIYNVLPPLDSWIFVSAWSCTTLIIGFILFWTREVKYAKF
ncbi:ABC transporter permease [Corynebacterium sp. TAE3-ERU16]|uniref:ABC transporter permease n=1 Tax=Corynebacterium sp. TAE3-ERU16 TaxID=2849493 RepID=UPI001C458320|nr:ABC transporter permease [Corynebacterium sp. TAE3-ERU16]MBV7294234.1 ABC transporter permease [Corynebacterium sp. TAE3-ERU16]